MVNRSRLISFSRALVTSGVLVGLLAAPAVHAQANGQVPFVKRHIYSETADPQADINAALAEAKKEHKRVLVDFGGDWCGDCQVLDIYMTQSPNAELLNKHFVVVHVFVDHEMDNHLDIAKKYGVPINRGVPSMAVLSPSGQVLHSQQTGEFADMRHMNSQAVTDFLNKWKG